MSEHRQSLRLNAELAARAWLILDSLDVRVQIILHTGGVASGRAAAWVAGLFLEKPIYVPYVITHSKIIPIW